VDIEIDGRIMLQASYGTSRNDTAAACGDDGNNGFGLLFNWNLLGDGEHTLRVLRDGIEFARVSFVVATLGVEFLNGASGRFPLPGFPHAGGQSEVEWQGRTQNFVIRGAGAPASGGNTGSSMGQLENPQPGSFQSGISVISGWLCTATRVDIEFDGGARLLQAAYGTSRDDTASACGDDGKDDGPHTLRVLRDGTEEVAQATFTVTTLGAEFVEDLNASFSVPSFPTTGTLTRIQWQERLQNFVLTGQILPGVSPAGGRRRKKRCRGRGDQSGTPGWENPPAEATCDALLRVLAEREPGPVSRGCLLGL
jgi:hypothetical protein